jgi:hypothetical protein
VKQPKLKWITPGGVLAVVVWLIASGLFAVYVSFSGSYNKTYGSLATVIRRRALRRAAGHPQTRRPRDRTCPARRAGAPAHHGP